MTYEIPYSFAGMRVHEIPTKYEPVLQLSEDFKWVSDEFRTKQNLWLLEKFGTRDVSIVPLDMALMFNGNIMLRQDQIGILKNIIA